MAAKKRPKLTAWDNDYLTLERAMTEDKISVRWREIRAITGAVDEKLQVIDGACTLYMEGELGFMVNHTREEIIAMVNERLTPQ